MKPISQLVTPTNTTFPLVDYGYQSATNPTSRTSTTVTEPRRLWQLSTDFVAGESAREWVAEIVVFTGMGLVAVWPVVFALHSVTRMVRGY